MQKVELLTNTSLALHTSSPVSLHTAHTHTSEEVCVRTSCTVSVLMMIVSVVVLSELS